MEEKQDIWAFHRVMRRLGRINACAIPAGKLSRGAYFCLAAICHGVREHAEHEGVQVWKLAERTHVHPPAVSRTLRELEARGLIARTVDEADRRNVKVLPTEKGLAYWEHAEAEMEALLFRVQEKMGADNIAELVALCNRLCDIMEEDHSQHNRNGQEA